ncbi:MAG: hypothetical protein HWN81_19340 [Candidatus Lokiarchaeota archaeon]|nr:hypothetical protein [Candidatus Lokiarchaeota archaeon]
MYDDKCRPIGYGEGDQESLEEWIGGRKRNILIVEYFNGNILIGNQEDQEYMRWVFNTESSKGSEIKDTHLLTKAELDEYLENRKLNSQYSM